MKTIRIDEDLCDGCGECVSACHEGAIGLVDGKARLVREDHCDGLGSCVGECPRGAITLVERSATGPAHSCPGSRILNRMSTNVAASDSDRSAVGAGISAAPRTGAEEGEALSDLAQWPVQLHLVSPDAPYFRGTDLLLAADCAAFARGDFHERFMRGHAIAIACPKLDDPSGYVEKLTSMMKDGGVRSVTVVTMDVPCCRGLERLVGLARQGANRRVPARRIVLGLDGGIIADQAIG
jgi:NAD-dependent dihydropyrimidine dehydrogenase PreA subunit